MGTDGHEPNSYGAAIRREHRTQSLASTQSAHREQPIPRLTADDVLTVGELAELLHVPQATVADWARRQVIPSVKLGRRRIFIRSKIEALLLAD
jgi:excisionase family DNA binding protein